LNSALIGKNRAHLFSREKMAQKISWKLRAQTFDVLDTTSRRITVIRGRIQRSLCLRRLKSVSS
jgi:hypothetical protein